MILISNEAQVTKFDFFFFTSLGKIFRVIGEKYH